VDAAGYARSPARINLPRTLTLLERHPTSPLLPELRDMMRRRAPYRTNGSFPVS